MAGSRATSAREPGQVRKEAALSGHRWAMRGRPVGAGETSSPRRPTSTEGARSIFASPRRLRGGACEMDCRVFAGAHTRGPWTSPLRHRGYRTVDARAGYGEWAATYEDTVKDAMDLDLLDVDRRRVGRDRGRSRLRDRADRRVASLAGGRDRRRRPDAGDARARRGARRLPLAAPGRRDRDGPRRARTTSPSAASSTSTCRRSSRCTPRPRGWRRGSCSSASTRTSSWPRGCRPTSTAPTASRSRSRPTCTWSASTSRRRGPPASSSATCASG